MKKFFLFCVCLPVLLFIAGAFAFSFYAAVDWFGILIPTLVGATLNAVLIIVALLALLADEAQPTNKLLSLRLKIGIGIFVLSMTLFNILYLSDGKPGSGPPKAKPSANLSNQKGESK